MNRQYSCASAARAALHRQNFLGIHLYVLSREYAGLEVPQPPQAPRSQIPHRHIAPRALPGGLSRILFRSRRMARLARKQGGMVLFAISLCDRQTDCLGEADDSTDAGLRGASEPGSL